MSKASKLKGRYLRIFTGEYGTDESALLPLALCTDTTVTLTADTEDEKTKDDSIAASPEVTATSWEASAETLYSLNGDGLDIVTAKLIEIFNAGQQVPVVIGAPTNYSDGDKPSEGWTNPYADDGALKGTAIITNLEASAPVDGSATCSITFTGVGTLTLVTSE